MNSPAVLGMSFAKMSTAQDIGVNVGRAGGTHANRSAKEWSEIEACGGASAILFSIQ